MEHLLRKTWPRSFAYQGPDSPRFSQTHSLGSRIFAKQNPGHVVFSQTVHEKKHTQRVKFKSHMIAQSWFILFAHSLVNGDIFWLKKINVHSNTLSQFPLKGVLGVKNVLGFAPRAPKVSPNKSSIHPRGPLSKEILFYVGLATLNLIVDIIYG